MIRERLEHWPQALSHMSLEARHTPHEWGTHDCALFAANCVEAITGDDLMHDIRGRYSSPVGAARVIKNEGFDSLEEMVASRTEPCAVNECRRGDVVICDGENGDFLAVVMGHYAVAPAPEGLVQVSLMHARRGFRV